LAFQVVDDILDVTGTPQSMGKAGGRDAVLRKATFPTLVGVAGARRRARELLGAALAEVAALPGAAKLDDIASLVVERDR
jgi:geranylgeranyl pyrophosphate synthase